MSDRPCTCHPDDNPPVPCPQKFALSECKAAAPVAAPADATVERVMELHKQACNDAGSAQSAVERGELKTAAAFEKSEDEASAALRAEVEQIVRENTRLRHLLQMQKEVEAQNGRTLAEVQERAERAEREVGMMARAADTEKAERQRAEQALALALNSEGDHSPACECRHCMKRQRDEALALLRRLVKHHREGGRPYLNDLVAEAEELLKDKTGRRPA